MGSIRLTGILLITALGPMLCSEAASAQGRSDRGRMAVDDTFPRLPAKSVVAQGWIARQMSEDTGGWVKAADQMSLEGSWLEGISQGWERGQNEVHQKTKAPFYQPLINHENDAEELITAGNGEYPIHWMDIVFRLGWTAGLDEYRQRGTKCVDDLLANQAPDGYMGVNKQSQRFNAKGPDGVFDCHSFGALINALLTYYDATGDKRVLDACSKLTDLYYAQIGPNGPHNELLASQAWYSGVTDAMVGMYQRTGDKKCLELAEFIMTRYLDTMGLRGGLSSTDKKIEFHTAGLGISLLSMMEFYRAKGDPAILQMMKNAHDMVARQHMQPFGIPSGHWESLAGIGPYLNTETCDTFWFTWFWAELAALTGEVEYADRAEKAWFNALPAARSKDGRVIAYFFAPNQLIASREASHTEYPARLFIECCQANAPRLLPIMTDRMVSSSPEGGLAVLFYGPCKTNAAVGDGARVTLTQATNYPFEDTIRIQLDVDRPASTFPLFFRMPGWCSSPKISINGKSLQESFASKTMAKVQREWKSGDTVELTFPMSVQVEFWQDRAAVVQRGPLLYALPVKDNRRSLDKWGSFEAIAAPDSAWNYALKINPKDPASSFQVKQLDVRQGAGVWDCSPTALEVDAVRVPEWTFSPGREASKPIDPSVPDQPAGWVGIYGNIAQPPSPLLPGKPFKPADKVEKIQLLPIGFTTLRMTYLPVVESANK